MTLSAPSEPWKGDGVRVEAGGSKPLRPAIPGLIALYESIPRSQQLGELLTAQRSAKAQSLLAGGELELDFGGVANHCQSKSARL